MTRQAAAVAQDITHRQMLGNIAVVHFKLGDVFFDGIVQLDFAVVAQNAKRRGDKGLGT